MTAPLSFPDDALSEVILSLPAEEEWPAYWVETPHGHTLHLCWPCCKKLLSQLRRLLVQRRVAEIWNYGEEWDSVTTAHDCQCCWRKLDHRLNDLGIAEELYHFGSLSDLELSRADINDIQRVAAGLDDDDLRDQTRETLLRFLRSRGTPFDPSKYSEAQP